MERSGGGRGREPAHWSRDGKRREVLGGSDLELTLHFNTNNRSASSRIIKKVMKGRGGGEFWAVLPEKMYTSTWRQLCPFVGFCLSALLLLFFLSLSHTFCFVPSRCASLWMDGLAGGVDLLSVSVALLPSRTA